MVENINKTTTLKNLNKKNKELEQKLHLSKLITYGSYIISIPSVLVATKLFENACYTYFSNNIVDKKEFGIAATLGINGALLLSTNIVLFTPELVRIKKEKKKLEEKKKLLLKTNNKVKSTYLQSVKTNSIEKDPLGEYIKFKEIEKALSMQIENNFADVSNKDIQEDHLGEYIKRKNI